MAERVILKADSNYVNVASLREKDFDNSRFTFPDSTVIEPEPVNSNGTDFVIDSFCEKPTYIPFIPEDKRNFCMYYPFGDKLDGYNLYDVFHKEYIPAKGIKKADDDTQYYEVRNKRYRPVGDIPVGQSLDNYFIRNEGIPLSKNSEVSRKVYSNSFYSYDCSVGEKINYTYDGVMPGTGLSSENLLVDCLDENMFNQPTIYNTKAALIQSQTPVEIATKEFESVNPSKLTLSFSCKFVNTVTTNYFEVLVVKTDTSNNVTTERFLINNVHTEWVDRKVSFSSSNLKRISIQVLPENDNTVKICRVMLNYGSHNINYDGRYHFKTKDLGKSFPIIIKFLRDSEDEDYLIPSNSTWTISYKRYINTSNITEYHIDQLGQCAYLGYISSKPTVLKIGTYDTYPHDWESKEPITEEAWDNVFIKYDGYTVYFYLYRNTKKILETSFLSSPSNFKKTVTLPDGTVIPFNLVLGGSLTSNLEPSIINYTKYSDLIILPMCLSDEEIDKMAGSLISIDMNNMSYESKTDVLNNTEYNLRKNLTVLRGPIFKETVNMGVQ